MADRIKKISIFRREIIPGEKTGQELDDYLPVSVVRYHQQWDKAVFEAQYNQLGEMEQQTDYEYNENGFLIREVLKEADGEVLEEKTYEPDDQNRTKKMFRHYADGSYDVCEYWYDAEGHLIKKVLSDDEGEIESLEQFVYEKDMMVKETRMDGDGSVISETSYLYDESGLLEEKLVRDEEQAQSYRQEYCYTEQGWREGILGYDDQDELVEKVMFALDDQGRPVDILEENRQKRNRITLGYDAAGNVVFQEEHNVKGELVSRVRRQYNENGMLYSSDVEIRNPLHGISQHYEMKHTYEYFDQ